MSDTRIRSGANFLGGLGEEREPNEAVWTRLLARVQELIKIVNGRISFGNGKHRNISGNIDGIWYQVYLVLANTDYQFKHDLGRVPVGITLVNTDKDGAVIRISNRNVETITLRSSVAATTADMVIV